MLHSRKRLGLQSAIMPFVVLPLFQFAGPTCRFVANCTATATAIPTIGTENIIVLPFVQGAVPVPGVHLYHY